MTLLSTVCVEVEDYTGQVHNVRALLDSGSRFHFITTSACQRLKLNKSKINVNLSGTNQANFLIIHTSDLKIHPRINSYTKNLVLADPTFNNTNQIDLLIGVDIFWELISTGRVKLGRNLPVLQNTVLAWVISGSIPCNSTNDSHRESMKCTLFQEKLQRFWELGECQSEQLLNLDETFCEERFNKFMTRDKEGRFIVTIPLKGDTSKLGDSKQHALQKFLRIKKNSKKNESFKQQYRAFMREYNGLNHMQAVEQEEPELYVNNQVTSCLQRLC